MRSLFRLAKHKIQPGTTLVEVLIAMVLMSFVMLSIANFVTKSNILSASISTRYKEASEVQALIQDMTTDFHRGVYISPNSYDRRLEYTTYDPTSLAAVKKIYTLTPVGGGNPNYYLQYSTDNGTGTTLTSMSPYAISPYTKYQLSGSPKFLYAHASNDCLDYVDDNGNGVLGSGDSTQTQVNCSSTSSFTADSSANSPDKSSKLVLANFNFTSGTGQPESVRNLPAYLFIAATPGLVRSNLPSSVLSPGVKDVALVQSFSWDNAVNPLWPSGFSPVGITWDSTHERLLLGSDVLGTVYQTERNGVFINIPITLSSAIAYTRGIAIEDDGQTLDVLTYDGTNDQYYSYNLSGTAPLTPTTGPTAFSPVATTQTVRKHLAYDSKTQNIYSATYDTSDTTYKIVEYYNGTNGTAGTRSGTPPTLNTHYWTLPAAFTAANPAGGLVIDNSTSDFILARNYVYASGGSNYIDIYRITRLSVATLLFSVNISDLGSSATGTTGVWGMAYDSVLNRIFLCDNASKKVYEISPPVVISSR